MGLWGYGAMGLWGYGAMGRVPDARYGAGEAGEEGGAVGLGELEQVAGQDLRHTSHLGGGVARVRVCECAQNPSMFMSAPGVGE